MKDPTSSDTLKSLKRLVPDYLAVCMENDIYQVRIIHGKGKGTLRRIVHAALDKLPQVTSYNLATVESGNWGATIVNLRSEL